MLAPTLSRRTIPGGASPQLMGRLPPLASIGRGGVSPQARPPLRAPSGMTSFSPSGARFSPTALGTTGGQGDAPGSGLAATRSSWQPGQALNAGVGMEGNLASYFGQGGGPGLNHSVFAGMYANEEQGIIANAQESMALEKERAIAGGYANSGYFKNLTRKLQAQTNAQLANARRAINAQEAMAAREDRWKMIEMSSGGGGGGGVFHGGRSMTELMRARKEAGRDPAVGAERLGR